MFDVTQLYDQLEDAAISEETARDEAGLTEAVNPLEYDDDEIPF